MDVEHLANYYIHKSYKVCFNRYYLNKEISQNEISNIFHYIQLFYTNNLIKQYYQLNNLLNKCLTGDEIINYLRKTSTSSNSTKFYIDTLEYFLSKKYIAKTLELNT